MLLDILRSVLFLGENYKPFLFARNRRLLSPLQRRKQINFVSQQDGGPPYWHHSVSDLLNDIETNQWFERHGRDD